VIQANASQGVHEVALKPFLSKCHRVLLIRPQWSQTPKIGQKAVQASRRWLGQKYDYLGLVGINVPKSYYCTELAVAAYSLSAEEKYRLPKPLAPDKLYFYGTILFDSGPQQAGLP
jgi:uncharacterized protein YycO